MLREIAVEPIISEVRMVSVHKTFGRFAALRGISCRLEPGHATLLMGPNGAGKSTLLSLISTLSRPTSGDIFFGPHPHRVAESSLRGHIGLMTFSSMLYPHLSGLENVLFFARLYQLPDPEKRSLRSLERVGIEREVAQRQPLRQLSRGMIQRVALARALVHEPELLLLDEPFSGLDRTAVETLRRIIRQAVDQQKIVLIVTHEVEAVDGLCDHFVILARGRIVQEQRGSPLSGARILEQYHATL
jgi:heme exporter protein A